MLKTQLLPRCKICIFAFCECAWFIHISWLFCSAHNWGERASIPFRLLLCFRGGYRALSFSGKSFHLDAFNHVGNAAAEALNRTKNKIDYAITRNVLGASRAPSVRRRELFIWLFYQIAKKGLVYCIIKIASCAFTEQAFTLCLLSYLTTLFNLIKSSSKTWSLFWMC